MQEQLKPGQRVKFDLVDTDGAKVGEGKGILSYVDAQGNYRVKPDFRLRPGVRIENIRGIAES